MRHNDPPAESDAGDLAAGDELIGMGTRDPEELRRLGDGIDDRTLTRSDDVQNFSNAIAGYDRTAEPNDSDQQSLSLKVNRKSGPEPKIATRCFPMCYVPEKRPNRNQNPRKSLTCVFACPQNPDVQPESTVELGSSESGADDRRSPSRSGRSCPIRVVSRDHAKSEPISRHLRQECDRSDRVLRG